MVKTLVGKSERSIEEAIRDAEQQASDFLKANPVASITNVDTKPYTTGPGGYHFITVLAPGTDPV